MKKTCNIPSLLPQDCVDQAETLQTRPTCLIVIDMGGMSTELTWQEAKGEPNYFKLPLCR